jgi:hypothetical protein
MPGERILTDDKAYFSFSIVTHKTETKIPNICGQEPSILGIYCHGILRRQKHKYDEPLGDTTELSDLKHNIPKTFITLDGRNRL